MNDALFEKPVTHLIARGHARRDIRTLFVPGRIELLGKHTDYCGGRTVTCALDRGFHVAFAPSTSPLVQMSALAPDPSGDRTQTFTLSPELEPTPGTWTNYPMSVARRLARNFPEAFHGTFCGADIAFTSTLPQAAGMSSSSALVVLTFLVLDAVNNFTARARHDGVINTSFELAEYLGTLENGQSYRTLAGDRGVGTFGGSEDHTAITLGRADRFGVYGYAPTHLEREVAMPADCVLAIASSGVIAEKTGAARDRYNRSSLLVSELVSLWNAHQAQPARTLATITRSAADAGEKLRAMVRDHVADPMHAIALLRRLEHFEAESETIIPRAMDALVAGDLRRFGEAVALSQVAAHELLQNQVPETRFLADAARDLNAAAASSLGAGFGGSVWAMVGRADADQFLDAWRAVYEDAFPVTATKATFFLTRPADGTSGSSTHSQGR